MYIIRYGEAKMIRLFKKFSNYLGYFQKKKKFFSKILGAPSAPQSSSGSATGLRNLQYGAVDDACYKTIGSQKSLQNLLLLCTKLS